eukprot:TRINITY_DN18783_c0_g1_i1.p1 TRINITY_DN18783_c0_g1~~TRINITY_DN18783_c0_g1_i1.p1  ORF type:complete len:294 (+),score=70.26 TRINITY_DN18783_c0_g1_i1:269-1150(+)
MAALSAVLIAGRSGAGKSTLGNNILARNPQHVIHYDVDIFAAGGDPIAHAGTQPTPEMVAARSAELTTVYGRCVADGFGRLFKNEPAEMSAFTDFYDLMVRDIAAQVQSLPATPARRVLVVTHSVFLRSVRHYIRTELLRLPFVTRALTVVLDPPPALLTERKMHLMRAEAAAEGRSVPEFCAARGMDGIACDDDFAAVHASWHVGFEPAQEAGLASAGGSGEENGDRGAPAGRHASEGGNDGECGEERVASEERGRGDSDEHEIAVAYGAGTDRVALCDRVVTLLLARRVPL